MDLLILDIPYKCSLKTEYVAFCDFLLLLNLMILVSFLQCSMSQYFICLYWLIVLIPLYVAALFYLYFPLLLGIWIASPLRLLF